MRMILAALTIAALGAGALPAQAETGNTSLAMFKKETAKARAAGGYGNPFVVIPAALMAAVEDAIDAMTGAAHTAKAGK